MSLKTFITMRRYTYALTIVTSLILIGTIINNASAYIIDLNNHSVWVQGTYGKLEATPHTLTQSGWVYFNITPYQNIGNIDMVWGFNTSKVKPKKAEFYKPHLIHWTTNNEKFFRNVSKIKYTLDDCCYGNSYNIYKRKITYQIFKSYNNITNETIYKTQTETVCFDSYIKDGSNYTVYWHTDHSRIKNWIDVSNKLNSVNYNYDNKTKWWYVTNFAVESHKTYTGRAWVDVPITLTGVSGKYDFAVKRSSDSLHDAISNHRFYLLDPWVNSSWSTKRNLHINYVVLKNIDDITENGFIFNSTTVFYNRYNDYPTITNGASNVSKKQIYRGYAEWNISSIPDDAIITDIKLKYHGCFNYGDAHINQMVCKPSISSNQIVYDDIGNGTTYINQDGFPEVGENKEIDLGNNVIPDLQNALSSNWFAIGIQGDTEIVSNKYSKIYTENYSYGANPNPTLCVEYTSESESLNYYQMNLNLSYSDIPEAQNDFDDIRFVNVSDGTSLPYWVEDRVNGTWCNVWVNVTSLHTGWNNDTVALYYGNSEASSMSDGDATFEFFDDFEYLGAPDSLKWVESDGSGGGYTTIHNVEIVDGQNVYHVQQSGAADRGARIVSILSWNEGMVEGTFRIRSASGNVHDAIIETDKYTGCEPYYYWSGGAGCSGVNTLGTFKIQQIFKSDGVANCTAWNLTTGELFCAGSITGLSIPYKAQYDLRTGNNGQIDTDVNNIRVRKYVANPPTYILGDAETYTQPIIPPSKPSFTEIDLIDQLHHEYTHIEPETMHIPIYTGLNYISIPLYQYNTSLNTLFGDHPITNDTIKKYVNGTWNTSIYNNGTWINASNIEPIELCIGYEYNRTGDNFTLNVSGYMKYNITTFNYKNCVGTNIIRPMRSDKDD